MILSYQEIDEEALENSKWLYIEGYVVTDDQRTDVASDAMIFAKQKGVKTSLSLSDPFVVEVFSDNIKTIIGEDGVDLLFCNGDEARSLLILTQLRRLLSRLSNMLRLLLLLEVLEGHWYMMVTNSSIRQEC